VFGVLYLVSGIYSVGFSGAMIGVTQPLSGKTAYIPVPDGLFPLGCHVCVVWYNLLGGIVLSFQDNLPVNLGQMN